MNRSILWHVASVMTMALALSTQAPAQTATQRKIDGAVNDYTAALDAGGPWHVTGVWSVSLQGESGKGDFSAAFGMVRADNPARAAHTHHVSLVDAEVTFLENGFRMSGAATITSNGNLAGFSGSPVDVLITGGSELSASNVTVTFGGAAAAHFGEAPLHGVVTQRR